MRVLLVHNYYRVRGGEDVVVEQEMESLRGQGVEVRLFAVRNSDLRSGVAIMLAALRAIYNPKARRELSREIAEFRPDVVHVHNFFPQLSPSIFDACSRAGVPSVMTVHNLRIVDPCACYGTAIPDPRQPRRSPFLMAARRAYRGSVCASLALAAMVECHRWRGTWRSRVDGFIALSHPAKEFLVARGLPAEKIIVKPNSVPDASRQASRTLRRGALFVGRLDEQKGVRTLLQAWKEINYPLTIIGDGPLASLVKAASNDRIIYLGRQSRAGVENAMRSAQILVFPSLGHEMFPMTIAEAFARGLPVVASAIPSLRDVVIAEKTGLLFPPGESSALVDCVMRALNDHAKLDQLRRNARRKYLAEYTPEANAAALIRLYRKLARGSTPEGDKQSAWVGAENGVEEAS